MPEEFDIQVRKRLARTLLSLDRTPEDDSLLPPPTTAEAGLLADLGIQFPAGLAPVPRPFHTRPSPREPLPKADVAVITWTVAERDGMADVLSPGQPGRSWYRYNRQYADFYDERIRPGAPSKKGQILGTYMPIEISGKKILLFKSELHLNQDGIQDPPHGAPGNATLPVKDLFKQIIEETEASHVLTVGTCGGIQLEHDLGDVLVTRAARFRCQDEFKNAPFNNKTYKSNWNLPTGQFGKAEQLMQNFADKLVEPIFGPPTKRHKGAFVLDRPYKPSIIHEKGTGANKLPPLHPILSTDFFEFGTSANAAELAAIGCGLEMGDAALGLAAEELGAAAPKWAVIRNISDPQINADLTKSPRQLNMQSHWAVWYYEVFGYWTSVMSAHTTWAVIADMP